MKITKEIPTEGSFIMVYVNDQDEIWSINYEIVERANGRKYTYAYDSVVDDYVMVDDLDNVPLPSYAVKCPLFKSIIFIMVEDE